MEPDRALVLYAVQGRISDTLFVSRTTIAAWRSRPTWYAVTTRDRTTAPELQKYVAARMGAQTIEVRSGHLPMITHPGSIARFILGAARTVTR